MSVTVTNSGGKAGKEAVLMFLSDNYATITPEYKSLKRFQKISLDTNESKTITFTLNQRDLQFVNNDLKWVSEKGTFTIRIADLKQDFLLK